MLGCHEFCGYYEWTFHYFRRRFGQAAVAQLWADAIGGDSQQHYAEAARRDGLAGLYRTWVKTGEDESCDWTFTLDEARNVLRWDMRRCPSKGFLLANGLNADEDYCDHCMGWMIPLLRSVGVEVGQHEHNHLGQCWGTMHAVDRPTEALDVAGDIRDDARWQAGYLDRWEHNQKQPLLPGGSPDPCQVLIDHFATAQRLLLAAEITATPPECLPGTGVLLGDRAYAGAGCFGLGPAAVLLGDDAATRLAAAARWRGSPAGQRPLLLYAYLPGNAPIDFHAEGLGRPLPILPLLIRSGNYVHRPGAAAPDQAELLAALARALLLPAESSIGRADQAK